MGFWTEFAIGGLTQLNENMRTADEERRLRDRKREDRDDLREQKKWEMETQHKYDMKKEALKRMDDLEKLKNKRDSFNMAIGQDGRFGAGTTSDDVGDSGKESVSETLNTAKTDMPDVKTVSPTKQSGIAPVSGAEEVMRGRRDYLVSIGDYDKALEVEQELQEFLYKQNSAPTTDPYEPFSKAITDLLKSEDLSTGSSLIHPKHAKEGTSHINDPSTQQVTKENAAMVARNLAEVYTDRTTNRLDVPRDALINKALEIGRSENILADPDASPELKRSAVGFIITSAETLSADRGLTIEDALYSIIRNPVILNDVYKVYQDAKAKVEGQAPTQAAVPLAGGAPAPVAPPPGTTPAARTYPTPSVAALRKLKDSINSPTYEETKRAFDNRFGAGAADTYITTGLQ